MTDTEADIVEPISTPPVKYSPTEAAIATMKEQLAPLLADPNICRTSAGYDQVRQALAIVRTHRVAVEKRRVELKKDALEYGRRVDFEAKRITALLLEIEDPLKAKKQVIDEEKEAEARAKIEAEKARIEAEERARREAEEAKLAAQRAEIARQQAELDARTAAEDARRRAEQERVEAEQRAERERLAAERRKLEEAQRAAEEASRIAREKLDAEHRAVQAEKVRLDRIEFERQAKERAEREAAEKAERDRKAAEIAEAHRKAAEEAETRRLEAARPDVEKVKAFGKAIRGLQLPEVANAGARDFLALVQQDLVEIAERCEGWTVARRKAVSRP